MKYDYLVVGAGLFGASFARVASDAGRSVLVIDKRPHVGGNAYTENMNGIHVHVYGPHVFHTDNTDVWKFVQRFAKFNDFVNMPLARSDGEYYHLPFNMHTFEQMWGVSSADEARRLIDKMREPPKSECAHSLEEFAISNIGRELYEKFIKGYTEKQWGRKCSELPASIIKRIPVRYEYDNRYFNDRFQGVPVGGYTSMVQNMLDGIDVVLDADYLDDRDRFNEMADTVVYSGSLDTLYDYRFGMLEYRAVSFEHETLSTADYQGNAVVTYVDADVPWTRITEHKWFNFGKKNDGADCDYTVISREFSSEWKPGEIRSYPINDSANNELYQRYKDIADNDPKLVVGGRLGEYKYMDMDDVIASALELFTRLQRGLQ